jgi:hypothetical protein
MILRRRHLKSAGHIACLVMGALAWVSATAAATIATSKVAAKVDYNRDIRPILSENCYACHGPDKSNRKAKLRLDDRDVAIERGAFKPGQPDASELVKRIFSTDKDEMMPPPDAHKTLTATQKGLLREWIAENAKYEPHWAYAPLERPAVPRTGNPKWVTNPIDAFVLHDLAEHRLQPSPPADKDVLIRRVSLDLTGLPPTPAEVSAFVNDHSKHAYEKVVDRLLASPHYGERMAVPWLDLARFTDTVGYHGDQNERNFPYRDYVIKAYNDNKPFDQFTIQQLAGDLLPHPTTEDRVATGFNRLNMVTREGGAQAGEYMAKYAADRVRTVATTWLGSTMGCCECHDHKFDPFLTKDFYSMEAFFADVEQWGIYGDYAYTPNPALRGFGNEDPFPPEIEVTNAYLVRRESHLEADANQWLRTDLQARETNPKDAAAFDAWRKESVEFLKANASGWQTPTPILLKSMRTNAEELAVQPDQSILATGALAKKTEVELPLLAGWISAIKLELIPTEIHKNSIFQKNGKEEKERIVLSAKLILPGAGKKSKELALPIYFADADRKKEIFNNGQPIIGVKSGWAADATRSNLTQTSVWLLDHPMRVSPGSKLKISLGPNDAGCLRVSASPFADVDIGQTNYVARLAAALSGTSGKKSDNKIILQDAFLRDTDSDTNLLAKLRSNDEELRECNGGEAWTLVTEAVTPVVTRILPRGNWQDSSGAVVEPAVPQFLPDSKNTTGRRLTRLDLARWLVSRDNPLTARTQMNRLWKQFFGNGISAVVDDLGTQGEWPVHQELLDWLASEFEDSGWNMKHMVKLIVMSDTYRQSSKGSPELHEMDPANRLLAAQTPRRLDAEFVRDNALAIAGLLDTDLGGPSVYPYQPPGYYSNLQFPERTYHADTNEQEYRRGIYIHWQRTFLQPMLANFDAPAREECTAVRNISNTPQQALTLLNDPTFFEAARVFAAHVLERKNETDGERLNLIYERALARSISANEKKSLEEFLTEQRQQYDADVKSAKTTEQVGIAPAPANIPAPELAAWTEVCRVVLNLHETITRY